MEFLKIVGAVLLAAICYGIAQDQVTARLCVEYFTIGHPDLFGTNEPTLLALGWGIVATWWLGLPAGILVAGAARCGRNPKLTLRELLRPMARVLCSMALAALIGGIVGYLAARLGWITLAPEYASEIPPRGTCCSWQTAGHIWRRTAREYWGVWDWPCGRASSGVDCAPWHSVRTTERPSSPSRVQSS